MAAPFIAPLVNYRDVFKPDIFKGKVLFCTGGGSGICRGMTEAIMAHGADAVIVGRTVDRLNQAAQELSETTGQKCIAAPADVRHPQALADAVTKAIEAFGRIDFVICGAAGNFLAPISALSENGFKAVMDIDAQGTYNTIKATLSHIRKSQGSYLMVSTTFHYRGSPAQVHVSAAKAAVEAISAVLAVEEGPRGVRSNVITPGWIGDTEGSKRLSLLLSEDSKKRIKQFPLGRLGTLEDVNNSTVFLLSGAAAYITGQILVVDGGSEHLREPLIDYPDALLGDWSRT